MSLKKFKVYWTASGAITLDEADLNLYKGEKATEKKVAEKIKNEYPESVLEDSDIDGITVSKIVRVSDRRVKDE